MKVLNKRISIGATFALAFATGAITYSLGYNIAMNRFNSVVSYNQEKQQMYSKLSEVDHAIRQEYIGEFDEQSIMTGVCSGYIDGIKDESCQYYTKDEYKKYSANRPYDENALSYDILNDVGYIRIRYATPEMGNMFIEGVKSLISDGAKKLIIDIRDVKDGEVESIQKCLGYILPAGNIISSVDKRGDISLVYRTESDGIDIKMAVIINKETSGVSELIASSLKDAGKAIIVGETTRGHAVKKSITQLNDGSAIIFPSAHYVTQSEKVFINKGIEPNIVSLLDEEKYKVFKDVGLEYAQDSQLQDAIKSLE